MAELKSGVNFGFGCMRFPRLSDGTMDIAQITDMIDLFIKRGFCYFDTAFNYTDSEETLKKVLVNRYPRDSYILTSKLSMMDAEFNRESARERIDISLGRLGVDYLDYYLLHNVTGVLKDHADEYELWDFMKELKAQGKCRHIGFSTHTDPDTLDQILTDHPEVELVQLQVNYIDWDDEKVQARRCLETARKHNKIIVIMEPVKGGALAHNLVDDAQNVLKAANPEASLASWALRFVASQPGVRVILSGMSTVAQVDDNTTFMADVKPLTEAEHAVIEETVKVIRSLPLIQCTACEYCVKGCPQSIPIPKIMGYLNRETTFPNVAMTRNGYKNAVKDAGKASDCVGCGLCEDTCPQSLPIRELMEKAASIFE